MPHTLYNMHLQYTALYTIHYTVYRFINTVRNAHLDIISSCVQVCRFCNEDTKSCWIRLRSLTSCETPLLIHALHACVVHNVTDSSISRDYYYTSQNITAAQNEVALSIVRVRGLCFPAVVFGATILV